MNKTPVRVFKEILWNARRFGITPDKWSARLFPKEIRLMTISIPKTGTHLLERVICLHPVFYRRIMKTLHGPTPENYGGIETILNTTKPGQVLVAHLPPTDILKDGLKKNDFRSIFIKRDPRAMIISNIDFILGRPNHFQHKIYSSTPNLKERIRLSIIGNKKYRVWPVKQIYDWYVDWLESEALVVKFEDLIGQKGGGSNISQQVVVSKIFDYLGLALSEKECLSIAERAFYRTSPTFREGKSEGWRKHFDTEMVDLLKEYANDTLVQYGYEVNDSW